MGKADISSKRLIALAPDGWVKWVTKTPDMVAQNLLDSEFQWISRDTDTLIKAYSPTTGEILALNEFQFHPDPRMPRRIRAYAGLAEEKYNIRVYPVLINIFPPEGNTPILDHYESEVLGLKARQDYRVINLWETDVELAFEPNLKGLLPLAPVMKDGASETILRRASLRLQDEERGEDLQRLLGIFATFVLGTNLVEQVMDLERQALLESPWGQ
ncbi:Rpn family recombination-promoting nuclease/putative transposase, partial [Phormidium pseudopriestleyi FRX01]